MLEYKVVEVSTVSEEVLEEVLNEWTGKGWNFEGMQFAMRESSKTAEHGLCYLHPGIRCKRE